MGEVNANRPDGAVPTVVGSAVVIRVELPQAVRTAAALIAATVRIMRLRSKAVLICATLPRHR